MQLTTYETNPAAAIELLQQEYSWLPSKELERRALQVFRTNAPKIRAALGSGSMFATFYNINEATLNALLEDYARALLGVYIPVATPKQIETLKPLLTDDAYNIDRWGLGLAVINNYWNISAGLQLYEKAHQTKEAAAAYLNELTNLRTDAPEPTCIVLTTIYQTEHAGQYFFDYDFFNEAAGEKAVKTFISQCYVQADFYAYTIYSGIVEYVLGGKEAPQPPKRIKAVGNLAEYAKARTSAIDEILQGGSEDDTIEQQPTTSTPENPMKVRLRAQSREPEEAEEEKVWIKKHNRLNNILSKKLEALEYPEEMFTRGKGAQKIEHKDIAVVHSPGELVPIAYLIENGLRRLAGINSRPSDYIIAQALGGLDAAISDLNAQPVKGVYMLDLNLNQYARYCGMEAEPWERKLQLIDALRLVSNVFLAFTEYEPIQNTKKKTKSRKPLFLAVQAVTLNKYTIPTGRKEGEGWELSIFVSEAAVQGGSQSILLADLQRYRREFKGDAGYRFIHQILSKNHINEDDLIDAVFGNKVKVKEAALGLRKAKTKEENPNRTPAEEAKLVKRTLQQNRPHQRKLLAEMFERAVELGLILWYKRTKGGKGYVYSWERPQKDKAPEELEA